MTPPTMTMSTTTGPTGEAPGADGAQLVQQILGVSLDGIYAVDRELRVVYWNDALEPIYGYAREEVRGRSVLEVLPSLEHSGEAGGLRAALAGRSTTLADCAYAVPGRSGFTESSFRPLLDARGEPTGAIAVVRDITQRKQEEALRKETESRFVRMADSSPVLLWMAGTDGLCNFFNQTWLRFTGRTLEQEDGVGWAEGVHPFDFQHCVDTYLEHFNRRQPFEMEYRLRRADGEFRWILDRGAPRYNPDGSFAGFIGSCTDITERKNLEQALQGALHKAEEASRVKSEFLANISHELRTPLNAIVNIPPSVLREFPTLTVWECPGCRGVFQKDDSEPEGPESGNGALCPSCKAHPLQPVERPYFVGDAGKAVHFLRRLTQSGQHLLRVVNDLLDFSKLDAGRMQLVLAEVDLRALLDEVAETVAPLWQAKGLRIRYLLPGPEVPLYAVADGVRLAQIFINLIGNAIKFTDPGGDITVGVSRETVDGLDCLRCWIQDTGIGIPKDKLDIIFESFRQADSSHTRSYGGTGLGLSICRQLVALHGGRIWVTSTVGEGSTFTFILPRSGPPR